MGLDVSSKLVVGVSMANLFTKIDEQSDVYDEHDKRGNKTGRQVEVHEMYATLPNENVICIGHGKHYFGTIKWELDYFNSMGFVDGRYIGDRKSPIEIHYSDYENKSLTENILGIKINTTGSHRNNETIAEINPKEITNKLLMCAAELKEMYGYTGEIKTYIITEMSY